MKITIRVLFGTLAAAAAVSATAPTVHADVIGGNPGSTFSSVVEYSVCPSVAVADGLFAPSGNDFGILGGSQICGNFDNDRFDVFSQFG